MAGGGGGGGGGGLRGFLCKIKSPLKIQIG